MRPDQEKKKVIICGIGNTLLQDEGVGVHVVRELQKLPLPPSVEVIEAGTMLLDFIFQMREARQVILVDAMRADGPPGSIYLLDARDLLQARTDQPLSLHQVGAVQILKIMALEKDPPPCLVIGIEPASLEWGLELSETIKEKMPEILKVVQDEIGTALSS
jgi:hydrogenase maturation protease